MVELKNQMTRQELLTTQNVNNIENGTLVERVEQLEDILNNIINGDNPIIGGNPIQGELLWEGEMTETPSQITVRTTKYKVFVFKTYMHGMAWGYSFGTGIMISGTENTGSGTNDSVFSGYIEITDDITLSINRFALVRSSGRVELGEGAFKVTQIWGVI